MTMLDTFNSDAFSSVSLTEAINKAPYSPNRLGELGIFEDRPITTTTAVIEERQGVLAVLGTAARGTMESVGAKKARKSYSFTVPHIPHNDAVMAAEVQNIRAFGSETETEVLAAVVNDKLVDMRANHEVTFEWHRCGAIKGVILDADGSTLYNLFTVFGISQDTTDFDLLATTNLKLKCTTVIRNIENALGATPFTGVRMMCGDTFWDELINHADVKAAYDRWMDGQFLRENALRTGFQYGGIYFENYRASVGGSAWIAAGDAYAFPEGARGLFLHHSAPADFIETVNTRGQRIYVKQEPLPFDKGIALHSQSNPLIICTRPKCLQKATNT